MRIRKVSLWTAEDDNDDDVQVIYQSPPDCQLIEERIVNPPAPVASKGSSSRTSVITGSRKRQLAPRKVNANKRIALEEVDLHEDSSNEVVELPAESPPPPPPALLELDQPVTGNYSIWENVLNPDSILTEVRIDNPVFVSAHNVGGKRIENYAVFENENEHSYVASSTPPNQQNSEETGNESELRNAVQFLENISSNPPKNTSAETSPSDRHQIRNNLPGETATNLETVIRQPLSDYTLQPYSSGSESSDEESLPESLEDFPGLTATNPETVIRQALSNRTLQPYDSESESSNEESAPESLHSSENEDSSDEYTIEWELGEGNILRPRIVSLRESSASLSTQSEETTEEVNSPSQPTVANEGSSDSLSIQREELILADGAPSLPTVVNEDSPATFSIQQEPFEGDSPNQSSGIDQDSSVEGHSSSQPAVHEDSVDLFFQHVETYLEDRIQSCRQRIGRIRARESEDSSVTIVLPHEEETNPVSSNPQASLNEDSSEIGSTHGEEASEEDDSQTQPASVNEDSSEPSLIEHEETVEDLDTSPGNAVDIAEVVEMTAESQQASENGNPSENVNPPAEEVTSTQITQQQPSENEDSFDIFSNIRCDEMVEIDHAQVIEQATGNNEALQDQPLNVPHSSNQQDTDSLAPVLLVLQIKLLWRGSIICDKTSHDRPVMTFPMKCSIFGAKNASGEINLNAVSWPSQMEMLILPLAILLKCHLYEDIKKIRELSVVCFQRSAQFMRLMPQNRNMHWMGVIKFPTCNSGLNMMFVVPKKKEPFVFSGYAFNSNQGFLFDKFLKACNEYCLEIKRKEQFNPSLSSPHYTTPLQAQASCSWTTWPPPCTEFPLSCLESALQPASSFQQQSQQTSLLDRRHLRLPNRPLCTNQDLNLSLPSSQPTSLPQACPLNLQKKSQILSGQLFDDLSFGILSQPPSQQARFHQPESRQLRGILPQSNRQATLPQRLRQPVPLPQPSSSQQATLPQPSRQQATLPQPSSSQQTSLPQPGQHSNSPEGLNSPIRVPQPPYQQIPLSRTSTLQQQLKSNIENRQTSLPIPSSQISTMPEPILFQQSLLETNQQTGLSSGFPTVLEQNRHPQKASLSKEIALIWYRSFKELSRLSKQSNQQTVLQQPSNQQTVLQQPSNQQTVLQQPSNQQTVLQQPSNQQTVLQQPSNQQTVLQQPSNQQTVLQQPSNQQTVLQQPSNQQRVFQQPSITDMFATTTQSTAQCCNNTSNQQTVLQQPSNQQRVFQQPSSQQTVLSQPAHSQYRPILLQHLPSIDPFQLLPPMSQTSNPQTSLPEPPSQQTGLLQPSSQQNSLSRQSVQLGSWPQSSNLPTDSMRSGVGIGSRWTGQPLSSPQTSPLQQQTGLYQTSNIQTTSSQTSGQQTNLLPPSSLQTHSMQTSHQIPSLPGPSNQHLNQLTDSMGHGIGISSHWTSTQQSMLTTSPPLQTNLFHLPNPQSSLSQPPGQHTNIVQPLNQQTSFPQPLNLQTSPTRTPYQLSSLSGSSNQLRVSMGHGTGPRWTGQPVISPQTLPSQQHASSFQPANPQTTLSRPLGQQTSLSQLPGQQNSVVQPSNQPTSSTRPPRQQTREGGHLDTGVVNRCPSLLRRTPAATRCRIQVQIRPQTSTTEYESADQHIDAMISSLYEQFYGSDQTSGPSTSQSQPQPGTSRADHAYTSSVHQPSNPSSLASRPSTSQSQQPGTSRMDHDYSTAVPQRIIELKASEVFPSWIVKKVMQKMTFKSAEEVCDAILSFTEDEKKAMLEAKPEVSEALLCKVCLDEQFNVLFEPCGHVATCMDCAKCLQKCPICRCFITKKRRIYMS
ncbi:hypothetical protein JTE90_009781 [Oedothorax gibbosus]|uniref:RING-type domain-containing protein n=1 Tax=Oedothorax gibbosus TaxID=931172 RepID=A0AAV6VAS2_9ARAC|nr:hypothetical protein JTE90_009781 [Oedothorax gibbosus]